LIGNFSDIAEAKHSHDTKKGRDNLDINEMFEGKKLTDMLIIDHTSRGYYLWYKMINYLCLVSSFIYADYAAYRHISSDILLSIYICEGIFLVDMIIQFFLDFPKSSSGLETKSVRCLN
jgi:hypothetical protein